MRLVGTNRAYGAMCFLVLTGRMVLPGIRRIGSTEPEPSSVPPSEPPVAPGVQSTICLRAVRYCPRVYGPVVAAYALSGTESTVGLRCDGMVSTEKGDGATRCAVLSSRMVLPALPQAQAPMVIPAQAMLLRAGSVSYAMSGNGSAMMLRDAWY
eukprot:1659352-Rhodomonas_salina.1